MMIVRPMIGRPMMVVRLSGHPLIRDSLNKYSTVGEQITVEQLTELSIVMRISRHDHEYRHHVRVK